MLFSKRLVNETLPKQPVRKRSYPFRIVVTVACILLCIFLLSLLLIFILFGRDMRLDGTFYKLLAVFIPAYAAILATSGWIIGAWMQDRTSIRQHTVNVLFATNFTNEMFSRNRRIVDSRFPEHSIEQYTSLTSSTNPDDTSVADAIRYLLNYFEYIAASVRYGDLDSMIFEETIDIIMVKYYMRFKPMIEFLNNEDAKVMNNLAFLSKILIQRNRRAYD